MYGENSSGRKVSLLNDEPTAKPLHQLPFTPFSHKPPASRIVLPSLPKTRFFPSSNSSCSTSPENSPSTPPLVRLNSISSTGTQTTPSPMTPSYGFDPLEQQKNGSPYYASFAQHSNNGTYPAMPSTQEPAAQPYYHLSSHQMSDREMEEAFINTAAVRNPPALDPIHTQARYSTVDQALTLSPQAPLPPPLAAPGTTTNAQNTKSDKATATTPTSATSKGPKKKYPCPHATRYGCHDTFTTSGHAARHGKKHTGEKNIHCPTCNKAFTRKDNMKQHERTHKNTKSDGLSISSPRDPTTAPPPASSTTKSAQTAPRSRRPAAAPKPNSSSNDQAPKLAPEAPMMEFDGDSSRLELSSSGCTHGLPMPDLMQDIKPNLNGRMPSISGRSEVDGEGDSPGLDALATVASEMVQ